MSKRKPSSPTDIVKGHSLAFAMGMSGSVIIDQNGIHQPLLFGRILTNLLDREHTWNVAVVGMYNDPADNSINYAIDRIIIRNKCNRTHLISVLDEWGHLVMDESEKDNFFQIGWVATPGTYERTDLDIMRIMETQIKVRELPAQSFDTIINSSITDNPENPGIVPITIY